MKHSEEKLKFLNALTQGESVVEAAKAAGVHRRTIYDWRDQDAAFRAEWDYCIESFREDLLGKGWKKLKERAFDAKDPKSHIMLIFMLKRLDPEFKENYRQERKIIHQKGVDIEFSDEDWKEAAEILARARSSESA